MLRLELPLLASNFGFDTGYRIVSWLCWVPNVLVAETMLWAWSRRTPAVVSLDAPEPAGT